MSRPRGRRRGEVRGPRSEETRPPPGRSTAAVAVVAASRGVLALVLCLAFWAAAPTVLGWTPTTVVSGSMSPSIAVGDVVVVRPVPESELVPGRVALFPDPSSPDRLLLHRIAETGPDGLTTRGDANERVDSARVDPATVIGIGHLRVRFIGAPVGAARAGDWWVTAASAVALALLLAGSTLRAPSSPGAGGPRRTGRRITGATAACVGAAAVLAGTSPVPTSAAFAADVRTAADFAAASPEAPSELVCNDLGSGAHISWRYEGVPAAGFELVSDGAVLVGGIGPDARSAAVPFGAVPLLSRRDIAVRARFAGEWATVSSSTVPVAAGLLGLGLTPPSCA